MLADGGARAPRGSQGSVYRPPRGACVVDRFRVGRGGQGTGRWTFSVFDGPGTASAIQGPSLDGSTMPSSSQV
ncbi:hypothetical protein GCM10028832_09070 [Streptomyces sparsus]